MDLDLLDGLKYGAIGLCGILFIISTRLLSKEQNREGEPRLPVLNMIKIFLRSAIILSIFFGLAEVFKAPKINANAENAITKVWKSHYSQFATDTTLELKIHRIQNHPIQTRSRLDTTLVCETILEDLKVSQEKLKEIDHQFYSNIVKLKKAIDKNGESINVDWDEDNKQDIYKILEDLFIKLDELENPNNSNLVIRNKWKSFKKKWTEEQHKFIFYSDVPHIVRQYLDKFHPNT